MQSLFDSHCHLEDSSFDVDLDVIVRRARQRLGGLVCSGVHPDDFDKVLSLVREHPGFVYASLGIHPEYAAKFDDMTVDKAIEQIKENIDDIVAVGEVGLDYFWCKEARLRDEQKNLFLKMIRFAKEADKPLVVHIRDGKDKDASAYDDAFEILEKEGARRVMLHMFSSKSHLQRALDNDWYISTNAIVQSSKDHKKIVDKVPISKLLIETDSPYLPPKEAVEDGVTRNEPVFVEYVAKKVAEVRGASFEEVCVQTLKNTKMFFDL